MKRTSMVIALLGLAATIMPALLFLFQRIGEEPMKTTMLVGTLLWFSAAPFWLKSGDH